jgi:sugar phosphate isomerase/epimerase
MMLTMMHTRREFGKLAMAAVPVARALAGIDSKVDGVQLGVQSYSFRDLSFNDALKAMVTDGLGLCELFAPHIELGKLDVAPMQPRPPRAPGAPPQAPDKAAQTAKREELRQWRLTVPMTYYEGIKKQFDDAGIKLFAYNYSFADNFTDEEIDRGFMAAKAMGVHCITASTTIPVAKRVAPFADKHKLIVAMHGHSNLKDPNQFAKPESFAAAEAMSKYFKTNLDIGHFTAANFDAVDYIEKHHDEIVLLHLKDRKKDEGPNTIWGEGDTPIKQVLTLLKTKKYKIPACIEYEYKGAASSPEEVKICLDYAKRVLAG